MKKQETVDAFMDKLDYPLKTEVQTLREIIKGVSSKISEQIKWNAPSYSAEGYIATFNFHDKQQIRLVFHNPAIASLDSAILEGDYPDRRLVYFAGMDDVRAKQAELTRVIAALVELMDKKRVIG